MGRFGQNIDGRLVRLTLYVLSGYRKNQAYIDMNERDISLDIVRITACLMVVFMHSPIPSDSASGVFLSSLSYFTAPCIGLFFMVSGALLLPVRGGYVGFIKKRFGKIIIPTILWSLIYIGLRLYDSESEINVLQTLASIPFAAQGEGVLWFMYTLAGLYLLAPILSAWVERATQTEHRIVLSLWCVTLCYPLLSCYVIPNVSTTGILYYFTGYAGYFLLGFYLKKYPHSLSAGIAWGVALCGIALLLALKHFDITFDFYSLFWYESIFIAALAVAIWKTIRMIGFRKRTSVIVKISNLSFGVYLIHILIMRHWLWHQDWIKGITNYPMQCITVAILTFLLSVFLCWLISLLPYSQWLIGYHDMRKKVSNN